MTDIRKNLTILIFVLSGVLASLLVLNFKKIEKDQKAQILDLKQNPTVNFPIKLSNGIVDSFAFKSGSDRILFYEKLNSIIHESSPDGKGKKELVRIPNVLMTIFSPTGRELVAAPLEKGILKNFYFDLENNKRAELPKNMVSPAFSPDGTEIAYFAYDDKISEGHILTSEPDGSNPKVIFKTRIKKLKLSWPEKNLIVLYSKKEDGGLTSTFSITAMGKELQRISQEIATLYHGDNPEEINITQELGIKTKDIKLSPLKDYLIFINAKDRKLYSLKI